MTNRFFLEDIVKRESAKAALRPFIIALEEAIAEIDDVDFTAIDPDTGDIFVDLESNSTGVPLRIKIGFDE